MDKLFMVAFIIFVFAELIIIFQLYSIKKNVGLKSSLTSFIIFCFILLFKLLFKFTLPYYILLLSLLAVFFDSFIGYRLEYYSKSIKFDRYLHGYSVFSYSLLLFYLLSNFLDIGGSKLFLALFIALLGISCGVLIEIFEFMNDSKHNTDMQRGLKDTNFDLIFDVIGSVLAAVFAYLVFL